MLRGIVNRALGGRRRTTGVGAPTPRPGRGGAAAGGSANREIERGARSVLRGVSRKKRGL
jgi:hypothetical protein